MQFDWTHSPWWQQQKNIVERVSFFSGNNKLIYYASYMIILAVYYLKQRLWSADQFRVMTSICAFNTLDCSTGVTVYFVFLHTLQCWPLHCISPCVWLYGLLSSTSLSVPMAGESGLTWTSGCQSRFSFMTLQLTLPYYLMFNNKLLVIKLKCHENWNET